MKFIPFLLTMLLIGSSTFAHTQTDASIRTLNITFTTKRIQLKNNYSLIVDTILDKRVVHLVGPKVNAALEYKSNSLKASELNLGYLHFDSDSFSVISTVNDIDTSIQMYRKTDGKLLLRGRLFTFHKQMSALSFYDYGAGHKFCVVDLISGRIENYTPPEVHCVFWHRCVEDITLTEQEVRLQFAGMNNRRSTNVYKR